MKILNRQNLYLKNIAFSIEHSPWIKHPLSCTGVDGKAKWISVGQSFFEQTEKQRQQLNAAE